MKENVKALIVDDEEEIGFIVSRILAKQDINATYVDRIEKGKEKILNENFDLFYLDLHLPDGTGFDLVPEIRQQAEPNKIFFISAYDGVHESERAAELKVDGFISKPFTKNDILNTLIEG
ncbi:MAG: response regulator [Cyclobacteriaceae bacterium]